MKFTWALGFSFFSLYIAAQPSDGIEYDPDGHFHWGLFQGEINPRDIAEMGHNTGAVIVSSLSYETVRSTPNSISLKVCALFHPEQSWTRYPKLNHPEEALEHEKRHFDICEIYARKFRRLLSHTQFDYHSLNEKLPRIFRQLVTEYRAMQTRYDQETHHSLDKRQQHAWNARIDSELKSLEAYSERVVTINLVSREP